MLEALAGAFETDILVVVYGQMPASADEEIRAAGRKSHLKKAVSWGILTLASYLILAALERHLDLLRTRTYNFMPYILLHTFVMPLISVGIAVSLMHALNVAGTVRIAEPVIRKNSCWLEGCLPHSICSVCCGCLFPFRYPQEPLCGFGICLFPFSPCPVLFHRTAPLPWTGYVS